MKLLCYNGIILLVVAGLLEAQLFFLRGDQAKVSQGTLAIPGIMIDGKDSAPPFLQVAGDSESRNANSDILQRGLIFAQPVRPPTSVPVVRPSTVTTVTTTVMQPPLCLACSCKKAFKSCKDAGGVQVVPQAIIKAGNAGAAGDATCTAAAPCVVIAPDTLSACDPTCKKKTTTCDPAADSTDCSANLDAAETAQCGTPCERLTLGASVTCSTPAIAAGVISQPPPVCPTNAAGRKRRETESVAPELQSSQDNSAATGRFLFGWYSPNPSVSTVVSTVVASPTTITQTSTFVGSVKATYVLPDGNCLATNIPSC